MRTLWKTIVAVVALTLLAAVQPDCAYACSCLPSPPPDQALADATAVFSGRVTEKEILLNNAGTSFDRVTFAVTRSWKEAAQPTLVVTTSGDSASCGFFFEQGQEYIVYANEQEGQLSTGLCSRTALLADASDDIAALGPGDAVAPTELPATGDDAQRRRTVALAAGALVLVACGGLVVRRRAPTRGRS
jgi:hypothetical protein